MGENEVIRRQIVFYGRVQDVGFRFTATAAARTLGLTGWVRNQYDGSVEMEVQGKRLLVEKLLDDLNHQRWIRIDRMEAEQIPLKEGESTFVTL